MLERAYIAEQTAARDISQAASQSCAMSAEKGQDVTQYWVSKGILISRGQLKNTLKATACDRKWEAVESRYRGEDAHRESLYEIQPWRLTLKLTIYVVNAQPDCASTSPLG